MRFWLIQKREALGLTQKNISELVGISQPSYCNIETGERRPSVETAKKIAEVLGFDWTLFYSNDARIVDKTK